MNKNWKKLQGPAEKEIEKLQPSKEWHSESLQVGNVELLKDSQGRRAEAVLWREVVWRP